MDYSNKTVIVTGASNGIGRGVAAGFAEKGASVVLADLDEAAGADAAAGLQEKGWSAIFIKTDVREETDIQHLMEKAAQSFGSIDILINNAGKAKFKPLHELELEEWDDLYDHDQDDE